MIRAPVVLLLLVTALACTDHSATAPESSGSEALVAAPTASAPVTGKLVPFKLKGDWRYAADGDSSICDAVEGTASATFIEFEGNATHLGRLYGSGTNCWGSGDPFTRPLLAQGAVFHAANGDVLYAFGDEATSTVFPDLSFEIGPVSFTSGTGRFQNAVGWYRLYGEDAIAAGPFAVRGMIASVGSAR